MNVPDRPWARLLEVLGAHGDVSEPAPGRLVWARAGGAVEIVMTPDEWASWSGAVMGDLEYTAFHVLEAAREAVDSGSTYLVFATYQLCQSDVAVLPDRLEEWSRRERGRARTGGDFGWFAYSPDSDASS